MLRNQNYWTIWVFINICISHTVQCQNLFEWFSYEFYFFCLSNRRITLKWTETPGYNSLYPHRLQNWIILFLEFHWEFFLIVQLSLSKLIQSYRTQTQILSCYLSTNLQSETSQFSMVTIRINVFRKAIIRIIQHGLHRTRLSGRISQRTIKHICSFWRFKQ